MLKMVKPQEEVVVPVTKFHAIMACRGHEEKFHMFLTQALMDVNDQIEAPATLTPETIWMQQM
jgi:hypothetical protein